MPPILTLIDRHALAYRTYFALTGAGSYPPGTMSQRWQTSTGEPTRNRTIGRAYDAKV